MSSPTILRSNPRLKNTQTTCNITDVLFGSGATICASIQHTLESTEHELVLVTCFWARSSSLDTICQVLRSLSEKSLRRNTGKIRVRICLSSVSLWQKLFHTQRLDGHVYSPSTWTAQLALPSPEELTGLDLQIKSIFIKPFSVMHPKFIIIDRQRVMLPSCNISWEDWFEGCIGLDGAIVARFVEFWQDFWRDHTYVQPQSHTGSPFALSQPTGNLPTLLDIHLDDIHCAFLPSPHHINPRFRLPWQHAAPPPSTPLNTFLLSAFRTAKRSIYLQTPNLTSPPVLSALLTALSRGVNVHIVTSARLMIVEQLLTAGTTTSRCLRTLIKRYTRAQRAALGEQDSDIDLERGLRPHALGSLRVEYYRPTSAGDSVQSHLKLTAVDGEVLVLGSGNMDRASWYTSQELGVAFESARLVREVLEALGRVLDRRKELVYDSR